MLNIMEVEEIKMTETVKHSRVCSFFNGRVTVDILKEFADSRGFVTELWRTDDSGYNTDYIDENKDKLNQQSYINKQNTPQMCYYSHTSPLVQRGPHEHKDQTDWFITLKSNMIYQFVFKGESKYFITDKKYTYRVKVEPGVIHSYRNLDIDSHAMTGNFPSSLFMGVDKRDEIDEIRHEEQIKDNKNIYVLGANGRLGKVLTDRLISDAGMHEYNVIPIMDKFENNKADIEKLTALFKIILDNRTDNDIVINCIAKTNVQSNDRDDDFGYVNFLLAKYITEFCLSNKIHVVTFSTDYVYQDGEKLSSYTISKKKYEEWIESMYYSIETNAYDVISAQKYLHVVRVANLFSNDVSDTHNLLNKLFKASTTGNISVVENLIVMPTSVEVLSKFLSNEYIHKISEFDTFINVSGKAYTIEDIFTVFFKKEQEFNYITDPKVINNPAAFINRHCYYPLDCDEKINEKVRQVTNQNVI